MSGVWDAAYTRRDGVVIPRIAIAAFASLLLHVALVIWAPRVPKTDMRAPTPPLTAYLRGPTQIEPPAAARPPRAAARATPPAKPPVQAPKPPQRAAPAPPPPAPVTRPPLLAMEKTPPQPPVFTVPATPPVPEAPPVAEAPPVIKPVPPPVETDLATYVEARRRARGELSPEAAAAQQVEAANKGALASAALQAAPPVSFRNENPVKHGGIFQIRRRGFDYAEFMFYGWNPNFRRETPQLIEVRKGDHGDIDLAVVRRIIELIRFYERGDFQWYSRKTGRSHTLSARLRDNAGLEEFMMREFYDELHRYR